MRKIFTVVTLLLCFAISAQKEVAKKVNQYIVENVYFKPYSSLLTKDQSQENTLNNALKKATIAKINSQSIANLMANKENFIQVQIPYQNENIEVLLYKVTIFADGFHVDTDKARSAVYEQGVYYRGIVKGDSNSVVSFNFFKNEMNGIISNQNFGNIVIGKINRKGNFSDYVIYSDADLNAINNIECHTKDQNLQPSTNTQRTSQKISSRCVTMYFEVDYDLFLKNGSDLATTTNWMTSVFNNVQTLYFNDEINISLKSLYIWTTPDPYDGYSIESPPSAAQFLYKFNEVRPVFDGDVGQLVANDNGAFGGVAATINGLCTTTNFSYSDVEFAFQTVPTYSWTVLVISHELGHLLGSPHTHACTWNGNNTAIDGCGPTADLKYKEGTCTIGPIPSTSNKGTIMSYCHLIPGVGMNFTNGFGPQPASRIISSIDNSNCLSTDCINTCINTVSEIFINSISNVSVALSWTDIGDSSSWEVSVTPITSNTISWSAPLLVKNYAVSNLLPNTFYVIRVRPICSSNLTAVTTQIIFVTSTDFCNGVTITDSGGESDNYSNLETYVRTIIPTNPSQKIRMIFSSFDLEEDYDYLYIYNGNSTSAPEFGAGFTGTSLPGTFESSAIDGSLTLKFFSDNYEVGAGYVAAIDCVSTLSTSEIKPNIDFTYYPNPSSGIVAIHSTTKITEILVFNLEGRLLHHEKTGCYESKVNMSLFANGTYFFKLKFDDVEANFKILKH